MTAREIFGIFGAGLIAASIGCVLPDIHDEGSPPASTSGGATGGGSTSGDPPATEQCTGSTAVSLRFANVAAAPGAIDFCIGPHDNLAGPIAVLAGAPDGVAFSSFMEYAYKADGPIDIRVIPAGGSCSGGTSLGDVVGTCLTNAAGASSADVYYIAGPSADKAVAVLPNEAAASGALKLRFFNAVEGADGIDFGLTKGSALPTTVSTSVASNIGFGHVPPAGNTILNASVNDAGFMEITTMPANITWGGWGAAVSGGSTASAVVPFTQVSNNLGLMLTIIAAGKVGDLKYPVQFIGFSGAATPPPVGGKPTMPEHTDTPSTQLN